MIFPDHLFCQSSSILSVGHCDPFAGLSAAEINQLRQKIGQINRENAELRQQAGYWKSQHQRTVEREELLKKENAELQAKLNLRERQLFDRKTEKSGNKSTSDKNKGQSSDQKKRSRGQQKGGKGHGRRDHSHLRSVEEVNDIPKDDRYCPCCGDLYEEFGSPDESEIIEIKVEAYTRRIKNRKYKKTCKCPGQVGILTASPAPRLIPKTDVGISIWTHILLTKFQFMQPTGRLLAQWKLHGLDLPAGTITDGLKRIMPMLEPVYEAIAERNRSEKHWHADETRWQVFEKVKDKANYRWYLWVFVSTSTVVYILDPSRAAHVPEDHFGVTAVGILNVDRYSAYKKMIKTVVQIVLAFCWAHVRRDFISLSKDWPHLEEWGLQWIQDIGWLYHLNNRRLDVRDQPADWNRRQAELEQAIDQMETKFNRKLATDDAHPAVKKILTSLRQHWDGLTVFVKNPDVPMDNNTGERTIRPAVIGRKNFYGSGAKWSGQLFVMMLSIFQTLEKWNINTQLWLNAYLQTCAENNGNAPDNISAFLPWNMPDEQRLKWAVNSSKINDSS
jgi:transposase